MLLTMSIFRECMLSGLRFRGEASRNFILLRKMIKIRFLLLGLRIKCCRRALGNKYFRFIVKDSIVIFQRTTIISIILDLASLLSLEDLFLSMMIIKIGHFLGRKERSTMFQSMNLKAGVGKRIWQNDKFTREDFFCGRKVGKCQHWSKKHVLYRMDG